MISWNFLKKILQHFQTAGVPQVGQVSSAIGQVSTQKKPGASPSFFKYNRG